MMAYSDSDWACDHGSRKSASSGCLMMDGILLCSSSRTQELIALSSAEAEVYAAVSTCCDAIYMVRCLEFVFEQNVTVQLLIDNSAARQILMRSGVGRVRHLSVILWLQRASCTPGMKRCGYHLTITCCPQVSLHTHVDPTCRGVTILCIAWCCIVRFLLTFCVSILLFCRKVVLWPCKLLWYRAIVS